jgi:hypothetical protein
VEEAGDLAVIWWPKLKFLLSILDGRCGSEFGGVDGSSLQLFLSPGKCREAANDATT